ncbi:diphthine--ammonia ligase isoform X2 [Chiloscyllium plagiosum]|uniref:diphthine--ammonia ligase isoform X2 n=1 Tax=Chiloscyllium plagiosum TaxID=36176 RepID=UPI001CB7CD1A|nr:diphthine--ammonia ligase isoform X2 [Chiloscyllium plagiosum]
MTYSLLNKMKVVALISGGKDSCYNMMQCVAAGHEVVALANLRPAQHKDELDSYMYQTVGHEAIDLYSEAIGLPLYRHTIQGSSLAIGRNYNKCEGDEVEDLYHLLKTVKEKEGVEGVSVGAILSDYQRIRVENVCRRLNLQPLAYLWRRNQEDLLREMILSNVQAMIIKVAAFGLDPEKHLGKTLDQVEPYLKQISQKYGVHVCGEGGEYETFTLDCPLFKKRIVIDSSEIVVHSADAFAPVGYLRLLKLHLVDKPNIPANIAFAERKPCLSCCDQESSAEKEDNRDMSKPQITWNLTSSSLSDVDMLNHWSGSTKNGYQWISATHFPMEGKNINDATKQTFSLLQAELATKEYELSDIILLHLYVKNMRDFGIINSIYESYFNLNPPARVCVEASLPDGVPLQIDCLMHKNRLTLQGTIEQQKETMHVQSISHWAPANIGPYSQSVKEQTCGETKPGSGLLIVAVFPHLPKDAAVEWHVIAVTDDPCERKSFIINKKSNGYVIDCELIVSSLKSSAAISLAVSLLSPSVTALNLKSMLHELAVVFQQSMDKLPQDVKQLPLCFKTFYCEDTIDPSFVRKDLERSLEDLLDLKFPLLILVPVADLPGLEILHVSCWLSS